jgi:malate dehydrogenase (oxaloacetate-decarboxylating)(NADP+)
MGIGKDGLSGIIRATSPRELLEQIAPELEVEGEMHGEAAISESLRMQIFSSLRLKGAANLLIMPNLDAAKSIHNPDP